MIIDLLDADPIHKRNFVFSKNDAANICSALEHAASWDKVSSYYELKRFISSSEDELTLGITQREAWRMVDGLILKNTFEAVSIGEKLLEWNSIF